MKKKETKKNSQKEVSKSLVKTLRKNKQNKINEKMKNKTKDSKIKARGRIFSGKIIKKFPRRVVIEFERSVYIRKYERYAKSRTKIHARLPDYMKDKINVGDWVKVRECRPLSKIIHFIIIEKIKGEGKEENKK